LKPMRTTLKMATSALLATAFFATSAHACSSPTGGHVFSAWGDPRAYSLAPDGGFEAGGAGWSLEQGAAVVTGNEDSFLNDGADSQSLSLPEGSSAVSPPLCVSEDTPFFRAMVANSGKPGSQLRVETVFGEGEVVRTHSVGGAHGRDGWAPTQPLSPTGLAHRLDDEAMVQVRFKAVNGDWQLDDFYIDPFARH
jgi:hypothetical protein